MSDDNLLTEWARLVAASLELVGVREVVVSPGSRSAPFAIALARRGSISITSVIDERTAAFVALGMARASARPAAVLATSGSAPAHWFPAVIEAATANVPLVLLSADRPLALAQSGAAQTIDQTKLFGSWVRYFADIGDPRGDHASLEGVVRTIAQGVAAALGPLPGPVHLNVRADKPLEPVDRDDDLHRRVDALIQRGAPRITTATTGADEAFARELATALNESSRPLVVVGPRPVHAPSLVEALTSLALPVAAEASSQLRFGPRVPLSVDAFELLFSSPAFAARQRPDLILQIGSLPTPTIYSTIASGIPRFVLDAGGVRDPLGGASAISTADAATTIARAAELRGRPAENDYADALLRADAIAWSEVERMLSGSFGEGAAVRAATAALNDGSLLAIGNSLPIRTLDRFVRGRSLRTSVLSQRGTNGIDGLVSGAIGAALATGEPLLALVGDVSMLHDAGSLLALATVKTPLVVVVIDNGGGRIFEELPIARVPALSPVMPLFTTPHAVDFASLAAAYGVRYAEARSATELSNAVSTGLVARGPMLVRAVVPPHDASESLRALRTRLAEVLP